MPHSFHLVTDNVSRCTAIIGVKTQNHLILTIFIKIVIKLSLLMLIFELTNLIYRRTSLMKFTSQEADYLINLLTNQLLSLLGRVNRWQTHSLSQQQYDQQVQETLQPELTMLTTISTKLQPQANDSIQLGAIQTGITKLQAAMTYQLTPDQLAHANERRLNRHFRD